MKAGKYLLVAVLILAVCAAAFAGGGQSGKGGAAAKTGGFKVASHNAVIEGNPYRAVYEDQMTETVKNLQAAGVIGT
ncbi:MAG: hypothetical protein LBP23_07695, partial [Treponema sp.]|nr:hypothetical protein [Treponema sp.]